jgi:hypothetical protein
MTLVPRCQRRDGLLTRGTEKKSSVDMVDFRSADAVTRIANGRALIPT